MNYLIYKITNNITKKSYVGKTNDLKRRLRCHQKEKSCRYLYNAIQKYGWHNFSTTVLEECTLENAPQLEAKWILLEGTLAPSGYNLVKETAQGIARHPETLKLMSLGSQGKCAKRTNSTSKFIGVRFNKRSCYYETRIIKESKTYRRLFTSEIEAAEAYDRFALYLFGAKARINFIDNLNSYLQEDLKLYFEKYSKPEIKVYKHRYISFNKNLKKWTCYIKNPNQTKRLFLGIFNSREEAENKAIDYQQGKTDFKPSSFEDRSLARACYSYEIYSPDGHNYKTHSLNDFCQKHRLNMSMLNYYWVKKKPCKSGSNKGWQITSKVKIKN